MTEDKRLQDAIDFNTTFSTPCGKKVLNNLSAYCYENRSTYVEGDHDKQNVNNGKRAVILYIRSKMDYDPKNSIQNESLNERVNYGNQRTN